MMTKLSGNYRKFLEYAKKFHNISKNASFFFSERECKLTAKINNKYQCKKKLVNVAAI